MKHPKEKTIKRISNAVAIAFWLILILLCLIYRDEITVDRIVAFTPQNTFVAVLVMLALFAVKSVSIFIYCGLLYAASGILFPLPLAVLVNILGSIIMATIPFWIGKKSGTGLVTRLIVKYPKLKFMKDVPNQNEFFMSFFMRIVGILPSDIIGMYLGASGIRYNRYITGALLGMLPATVTFCIMGTKINDVTSPEFLFSLGFELCLMVVSTTVYVVWMKKVKRKNQEVMEREEQHPDSEKG